MNSGFNLLLMHQPEDIHPRTWICLKGQKLKSVCRDLEKEVLENHNWSKATLSKFLSEKLQCANNTIRYTLEWNRNFYPIIIILELLMLSKNKETLLKRINEGTEYLKVNSASAKPVKAVFRLNENISKILGAFMADGSFSMQVVFAASNRESLLKIANHLHQDSITYSLGNAPSRNQYYISAQAGAGNLSYLKKIIHSFNPLTQIHYNIELTDEYKDNVEAFLRWIKEEFYIRPNRFEKKQNAWRIIFSNKILARYLMIFFEVRPGLKTYTAFEPMLIKNSSLNYRKAFAKGVLMFDGCVTFNKNVSLMLKSEVLIDAISDIWKKDGVYFGKGKSKREEWYLYTTSKNNEEKLLAYFEPDTQKWNLLQWLGGNLNHAPKKSGTTERNPASLQKILDILQKTKSCDSIFLQNYFKRSHYTIRTYLKILKAQQKITLSNQPKFIGEHVDNKTTILLKTQFHNTLFSRVDKKFKTDKNFAEFLIVRKATLSAWRVRKNRMPFYILKKMCGGLELDLAEASANIEKVDREIAEII